MDLLIRIRVKLYSCRHRTDLSVESPFVFRGRLDVVAIREKPMWEQDFLSVAPRRFATRTWRCENSAYRSSRLTSTNKKPLEIDNGDEKEERMKQPYPNMCQDGSRMATPLTSRRSDILSKKPASSGVMTYRVVSRDQTNRIRQMRKVRLHGVVGMR